MKLIWEPLAEEDRVEIYDFIEADRRHAALDVDDLILEAIGSLQHLPLGDAQAGSKVLVS